MSNARLCSDVQVSPYGTIIGILAGILAGTAPIALVLAVNRLAGHHPPPAGLVFGALAITTFPAALIGGRRMGKMPVAYALLLVALAGCGSGGWRHDGSYWGSGQGDLFITVRIQYPDKPRGASFTTTVLVDGLTDVIATETMPAGFGWHELRASYRLKADPARSYTIRATLDCSDTTVIPKVVVKPEVVEEDRTTTVDIEL